MFAPITFTPIGVVRSPLAERASAPRQPPASGGVAATIELAPGRNLEHAVCDLDAWDHIWVVFCFHANASWRPKVLPPRSKGRRRGVLATRSPHRPNPIGLSVVRLLSIEGLVLHVEGVDMLDGTPVLDIKPYVAYADAHPGAGSGWLAPADPEPGFDVVWSERAEEQARFLEQGHGVALRTAIDAALALGPAPHPYRRIKAEAAGLRIAIKDWRVRFFAEGRRIVVDSIATGWRARDLETSDEPALSAHRAFVARFGK